MSFMEAIYNNGRTQTMLQTLQANTYLSTHRSNTQHANPETHAVSL